MPLKILQISQENIIKKRLQHRCFPVKFAKFLRTPILKNIYERLLFFVHDKVLVIGFYVQIEDNNAQATFLTGKAMVEVTNKDHIAVCEIWSKYNNRITRHQTRSIF